MTRPPEPHENDDEKDDAADLVSFFRALRPEARHAYEALAARDLAHGEDLAAERRALGEKASGS